MPHLFCPAFHDMAGCQGGSLIELCYHVGGSDSLTAEIESIQDCNGKPHLTTTLRHQNRPSYLCFPLRLLLLWFAFLVGFEGLLLCISLIDPHYFKFEAPAHRVVLHSAHCWTIISRLILRRCSLLEHDTSTDDVGLSVPNRSPSSHDQDYISNIHRRCGHHRGKTGV